MMGYTDCNIFAGTLSSLSFPFNFAFGSNLGFCRPRQKISSDARSTMATTPNFGATATAVTTDVLFNSVAPSSAFDETQQAASLAANGSRATTVGWFDAASADAYSR